MDFSVSDPTDQSFHFSDLYVLREALGKGSFGRVARCLNKETNQDCAVKIISKTDLTIDLEAAASEVQILAGLNHPNVLKFQGIHQNKHHIFLEMELLRGGTLSALLRKRRLSDEEAATVMRGIFKAVSYLHGRDILHRDLKPDNIMFLSEDLNTVKVVDFGLSAKFGQHIFAKTFADMCGTVSFMAPEQVMHRSYSKPVDLWSSAMTLYMTITGKHPLLEPGDTVQSYTQKLKQPVWSFPEDFNPLARQLFLHLTNNQPLERYTADQALCHPWITRTHTEVPKTYLERMSEYNSQTQLWRLCGLLVALGVLMHRKHGKATGYPPAPPPPSVLVIPEHDIQAPSVTSPKQHVQSAMPTRPPLKEAYKSALRRRSTDCLDVSRSRRSSTFYKAQSPHSGALRPTASSYLRKPQLSPQSSRKSR